MYARLRQQPPVFQSPTLTLVIILVCTTDALSRTAAGLQRRQRGGGSGSSEGRTREDAESREPGRSIAASAAEKRIKSAAKERDLRRHII